MTFPSCSTTWVVLVGLLALHTATAHPLFWAVLNSGNCTALPTTSQGPHGTSVTDMQTKLVVKKNGQAVTKVCPGVVHRVLASFPDKREFIVTSNKGTFNGYTGSCPNRATSSLSAPVSVANLTFSLPCTATGTVQLTMLSVSTESGDKTFQAVAAALPVSAASSCPASTCNAAAGTGTSAMGGAVDLSTLLPTLLNGAADNGTFTLDPASVITVLKNLGNLVKNNSTAQPQSIINFVQSLGSMIQSGSSGTTTAATANPTDVPSALFALLAALGQVIPSAGTPPSLGNLMNFIKAVGNLLNLLSNKSV